MADLPPPLFDPALLARRRDRAMMLGFEGGADFLHAMVRDVMVERLADVTRDFPRTAVLGAATGGLARRLAPKAGGEALTLLDPSPAMAARSGAAVMQSEVLALEDSSQDLILSPLLLHWANDPVGQLVQMRRALRPDGLMIAALYGGQTLNELRSALAEAEAEVEGGLSQRVAPMAEIRDLGGLLQRASFAMPVADSERITASYDTPLHLMRELRAMGETNMMVARRRGGLRRETLARACEIYARHFSEPDGRVCATFEIVFLTGWAPGPDQPKALRPGSAKSRLADALGTVEIPTGEKPGQD